MSDEGFLRRWARRKTAVREGREPVADAAPAQAALADADPGAQAAAAFAIPAPALTPAAALQPTPPQPSAPQPAPPLPTMEDVATLHQDSDFSAFVARGVDQAVRRGALKKLFADPHFNVMDGLDIYIDDYNKASPMSETMLASLEHAKSVFMKMVEDEPPPSEQASEQPPEQETQ